MKIKELRQKSPKELDLLLKESRIKLRQFRFDLSSKKIKNVREIPQTKRLIAQILTIKRERSK